MGAIRTFRDGVVWQKAMDFAVDLYRLTSSFSKNELYGLVAQFRRCAISVPSNIAEGFSRKSSLAYRRFLDIALRSLFEAQTQLDLAGRLGYVEDSKFKELHEQTREIERMLCSLKMKLKGC